MTQENNSIESIDRERSMIGADQRSETKISAEAIPWIDDTM